MTLSTPFYITQKLKFPHRILLVIGTVALMAAGVFAAVRPQDDSARKADYIFLEASAAYSDGRLDDYYMLLRRAAALNPTDPFIAGALAEIEIEIPDSATSENAYSRLKERFYAMPTSDEFANTFFTAARTRGNFDDMVAALRLLSTLHPDRTSPTSLLADTYAEQAMLTDDEALADSALVLYRVMLDRQGFVPYFFARRLAVYQQFGRDSMIVAELSKLGNETPLDAQVQLFIGQCYASIEEADSALAHLSRAEALDSSLVDIYSTRASVYRQEGRDDEYQREMERAVAMPALPFETKIQLWGEYMQQNAADSTKTDQIKKLFGVLELDHPDEPTLHNVYGSYLQYLNDLDGAIEQFDYVTNLAPTDVDNWNLRLNAYTAKGDPAEIERVARETLDHFPNLEDVRFLLALSVAFQGRDAEAVAMIDTIRPTNDRSKLWASSIYEIHASAIQYDSLQVALKYFDKATSLNPENYSALNNSAYMMAVNGIDLDRAEINSMIAVASDSSNPTYIDTYAWVLFKKQDLAKAREQIDLAMRLLGVLPPNPGEMLPELDPEMAAAQLSWELYDHAGDIHYLTGDQEGAFEFWQRALELKPDDEILQKKVKNKAYLAR